MARRTIRAFLAVAAIGMALVAAHPADAHPLGNYTINHFAAITVGPTDIGLDVVIDMAEIPTFQERQRIDVDGDGEVSDAEARDAADPACGTVANRLRLAINGGAAKIERSSTALSFGPGLGGLSTMRLECSFEAHLPAPITARTSISFEDDSYPERIGWREIIAQGNGVAIDSNGLPEKSLSKRLTDYPMGLVTQPLDMRSAAIVATPSAAPAARTGSGSTVQPPPGARIPAEAPGAVPGGIGGGDVPAIFREVDLTPLVLLLSLVTAFALGAGHALTPGHGKTLMAAYLVGSRGQPIHAVGLGLSVTVSHTLGILVIAAVVVGAQGLLAPDVVVRTAPAIAAVTITALGAWMLVSEVRKRLSALQREAAHRDANEQRVEHDHDHSHAPDDDRDHMADAHPAESHSHGGITHNHVPEDGSTLSWRGLFALGLAGGLIPSTSALFILLGSIVAGRPAFGFVLVVVFGLGMAVVMTALGLATVFARGRLDRMPSGSGLGRVARQLPLVAAVVVLTFGVYLSIQAIGGPPNL